MTADATERTGENRADRPATILTGLTALGIVYGDLGTSPLYTLQTVMQLTGHHFTPAVALGVLSLIFWALIITISIKYCLFVMRADNHGEGGILALMTLVGAKGFDRHRVLVVMGLFGAALIYGDGIITPAISVLSAVEGVNVATTALKPYIVPIAVVILFTLFAFQGRGTARIGKVFGPLMLLWFVTIGLLGVAGILRHPAVLAAASPGYALRFLAHSGWEGFAVLGGVFLAITGGEALYADMGHMGRKPIRTTWYGIVLPALLLNYAGQTALLVQHPDIGGNPFFKLVPGVAIYPMVVLATIATIIASQAIITGSFSLTRQAMQLGWFPGVHIRQTSDEEYGQIYVPFVNWTMMVLTLALTIAFRSSDRLAGAYGTAVSTTMLLTTALLYHAMRDRWGWSPIAALGTSAILLVVDFAFFSANLLKIAEGGWIPLSFGILVFIIMTTWRSGVDALRRFNAAGTFSLEQFVTRLRRNEVQRVPGTAIFLTRMNEVVPPLMSRHLEQTGVLPEVLVALTVTFADIPRVPHADRLEVVQIFDDFWHITAHFGFVEVPDLLATLGAAKTKGCPIDLDNAHYFAARDDVQTAKKPHLLWRWQAPLFAFLYRNAVRPVDLFNIPPQNFVEVGRRIQV